MKKTNKSLTVVVVDDNAVIRSLIRTLLNTMGHQVVGEASNGESALALVRQMRPDVVTLDHNMPHGQGIDILPKIVEELPLTHVLVISAADDRPTMKLAFDRGAIGYVTKPLTADSVFQAFEQIVLLKKKTAGDHSQDRLSGKRCVIADDNRSMCLLLSKILEEAGVQVLAQLGNGRLALEAIEGKELDFVCLDIDMPEMTGLEVLERLREANNPVPVLFVTARADQQAIAKAVALGVSALLIKPFTQEKVIASVSKALNLKAEHAPRP